MKIGFIGCGNMGSALASAICKLGIHQVYISDKNEEKLAVFLQNNTAETTTNENIAQECDFVFLAVKPNSLRDVLTPLFPCFEQNKKAVIVSMAAGIAIEKLYALLPENTAVIRIMPNTPVAVGEGIVLWCTNNCPDLATTQFEAILSMAGTLSRIDERLIDAASALSGCGPAFVYMFIDALADGAVAQGLPRTDALTLATQTVFGSAKMVAQTGKHPAVLREEVCSPEGSTIDGVYALEKGGFKGMIMEAVSASYEKTKKLEK